MTDPAVPVVAVPEPDEPRCCTGGDCCGPGSYCCARTGPHTHEPEPEPDDDVIAAIRRRSDEGSAMWDDPISDARYLLARLATAEAEVAYQEKRAERAEQAAARMSVNRAEVKPLGNIAAAYKAELDKYKDRAFRVREQRNALQARIEALYADRTDADRAYATLNVERHRLARNYRRVVAERDAAVVDRDRLAAKVARVEALIDPEAGMAATPYGTGAGRYFEERNLRAALADPEEPQ